LLELNIYENIFSNHLTGNISLTDSFNLPYTLPVRGEEILECKFGLPALVEYMPVEPPPLHITNLSDRFLKGSASSEQFALKFVSEQCMSNLHSCVSKAYTDWPLGDVIFDIWENYLDDDRHGIHLEPTYNNITCIIPSWHPHEAINWLIGRARPQTEGNAVNYLYYETLDGIICKSLQTLAKQQPVLTMGLEQRVDDQHSIEALSSGHVKVDKLYFVDDFKKLHNVTNGYYTSKLLTHDITTKKILQYDYSSIAEWEMYNHISEYRPIADSEIEIRGADENRTSFAPRAEDWAIEEGKYLSQQTDSHVHFYPTHTNLYQNSAAAPDEVLYHNEVEEWRSQRYGQLSYFSTNAIRMRVECGGVNSLRAGNIVKLFVPTPQGCVRPEDAYDKFLSGNYMVSAIRHIVSTVNANTDYKMIVDLISDGLSEAPPERTSMRAEK
jgi:hypothetical protein